MSLPLGEEGRSALERIEGLVPAPLEWESALEGNPSPDRAALNLERWLSATGNPTTYLQTVLDYRAMHRVLMVLGASQHLADAVFQNPELGTLLLEEPLRPEDLVVEADRELPELVRRATSPSHVLDRLRYFKQKWNLRIATADLEGSLTPREVWRCLSLLAERLILQAAEALWAPQSEGKPLPLGIVAFGKLGGSELNYSSDVDLAYFCPDGLPEEEERKLMRFCEQLGRSLEQRMGRGGLYRVDLRLRPYGGTGPILRSIRSFEAYYERYAEPWERLALIRTRVLGAPEFDAVRRWDALRERNAFPAQVSEMVLGQLLEMRGAIEDLGKGDDLKRGAGGIRDIEFLVQLLQMVHGHRQPGVRQRGTLEALDALRQAEAIPEGAAAGALAKAYVFLRQLEHRCQLGDLQTHSVPESPEAREELARLMGLDRWASLRAQLDLHRRTARTLFDSYLRPESPVGSDRAEVAERAGGHAQALLQWFDVLPESEAFYQSLSQNEDSLDRVLAILERAPVLVDAFRASVGLSELLISGELEEEDDPVARFRALPLDAPLSQLAEAYLRARTVLLAQGILGSRDVAAELSDLADALLHHCLDRLGAEFDTLALGSYGVRCLSPNSDLDLLLLVPDDRSQANAEAQAQSLLGMVSNLRRYGVSLSLDLRLRPDGGKGLLVRTYAGFSQYDLHGMEMWERFALCQARAVRARPEALALARQAAVSMPLDSERMEELLAMKRRIDTERVPAQHAARHIKLGVGGLGDLEWFVHLHEMKDPERIGATQSTEVPERIRALTRAGWIHAVEAEELGQAFAYYQELRTRLALLGIPNDTMPENPDKLDRLARSMGLEDGNELLRRHQPIVERVRSIFVEGIERLIR